MKDQELYGEILMYKVTCVVWIGLVPRPLHALHILMSRPPENHFSQVIKVNMFIHSL